MDFQRFFQLFFAVSATTGPYSTILSSESALFARLPFTYLDVIRDILSKEDAKDSFANILNVELYQQKPTLVDVDWALAIESYCIKKKKRLDPALSGELFHISYTRKEIENILKEYSTVERLEMTTFIDRFDAKVKSDKVEKQMRITKREMTKFSGGYQ